MVTEDVVLSLASYARQGRLDKINKNLLADSLELLLKFIGQPTPAYELDRFDKVLYYYRNQNGLSITELAKRTGISASSLRRYENNELMPKEDARLKLAEALKIPENLSFMGAKELQDVRIRITIDAEQYDASVQVPAGTKLPYVKSAIQQELSKRQSSSVCDGSRNEDLIGRVLDDACVKNKWSWRKSPPDVSARIQTIRGRLLSCEVD